MVRKIVVILLPCHVGRITSKGHMLGITKVIVFLSMRKRGLVGKRKKRFLKYSPHSSPIKRFNFFNQQTQHEQQRTRLGLEGGQLWKFIRYKTEFSRACTSPLFFCRALASG